MGAFLSGHFDYNKPNSNKTIELQNPKATVKELNNSKNHFTCRKVSLTPTRNKPFQDFLKKSYQSVNLLKLTDPCLDFMELNLQYSQLERNSRKLGTVKRLAIGWWFDPDEVDGDDLYGDEDDDDYWEEFEDDRDFAIVPKPYVPKKDVFSFLKKHLKDMKDLTRIKIDAVSELNKYTHALQTNLKNLKKMKEICIQICETELTKKDILNLVKALKNARSIETLSLSFQWCHFPDDSICLLLKALPKFGNLKDLRLNFSCSMGLNQKSYEMIAKLPANLVGLESFLLNLKRQNLDNSHIKLLVQSLEKNKRLKEHRVILEHCEKISFWTKLKVCQKKGFFVFNSPAPEYSEFSAFD